MRQVVKAPRAPERNAPCPCGSGKKYKHCCLPTDSRQHAEIPAPPPTRQTLERALALHLNGAPREAEALYHQVLAIEPENADALHLAGVAATQHGRHEEAIAYITRAIAVKGTVAIYHRNLGLAWRAVGDVAASIACLREALRLQPDDAETHKLLGEILHQRGALSAAVTSYLAAVRLCPTDGVALRDLGNVFATLGDHAMAAQQYQAAVPLLPDNPDLHNNLGMALSRLDLLPEARSAYERGARLFSDSAVLGMNLVGVRQEMCDWDGLNDLVPALRQAVYTKPDELINPFLFLTIPGSGAEQLACARNWAVGRFAGLEREAATRDPRRRRGPRERLHLGYLSADFHDHATALLIAEMLERHDRDRFLVSAYSYGHDDGGSMRRRIMRATDQFVDLSTLSHAEAAQRIAADGVDILLDLKGYTQGARTEILALRPAPVQVSFLGFPGTMGAPFIDYLITDPFITPPRLRADLDERPAYLPDCYQPNDRQRPIAAHTTGRADCGLPETGFVFCCFNQEYKITAEVFAIWMRLLAAMPGSVLWLLETNPWARENLRHVAQRQGIDPERLVFAPRVSVADHLARHLLADLFLDTLPVNAHTTASDALWAGLPLVTCAGDTFVSRVAGSLLHAVGMPELVTTSLAEYEALALALARDPERLAALRARLALARDSAPLFDSTRYTRNLEALFWRMWEQADADGPVQVDEPVQAVNAVPPGVTTAYTLRVALALHQRGQLQEAVTLYEQVLAIEPENPDALHLIGVAADQDGQHELAVAYIGRAIALRDDVPGFYHDLGLALRHLGDLQAAIGCVREGLRQQPDDQALRTLLGVLLKLA